MLESSVIGILHGIPHGDDIRVQVHIGLSSEGGIPEVGIPVTIGAHTAADHFSTILCDKQASVITFHELTEELLVGDETFGFQDVMTA